MSLIYYIMNTYMRLDIRFIIYIYCTSLKTMFNSLKFATITNTIKIKNKMQNATLRKI